MTYYPLKMDSGVLKAEVDSTKYPAKMDGTILKVEVDSVKYPAKMNGQVLSINIEETVTDCGNTWPKYIKLSVSNISVCGGLSCANGVIASDSNGDHTLEYYGCYVDSFVEYIYHVGGPPYYNLNFNYATGEVEVYIWNGAAQPVIFDGAKAVTMSSYASCVSDALSGVGTISDSTSCPGGAYLCGGTGGDATIALP